MLFFYTRSSDGALFRQRNRFLNFLAAFSIAMGFKAIAIVAIIIINSILAH